MKNKILSFMLIICVALSCCVTTCSFASAKRPKLVSDTYSVTYSENGNTISDIPMNTSVNTLLYNLRKENPDLLMDVSYSNGKLPQLWSNISERVSNRMYITVRSDNSDGGERFALMTTVSTSVFEDFEGYATGSFVSDYRWSHKKTSENIGVGYIADDAASNRFFRISVPAVGDSDYTASSSTDVTPLGSMHLSAPDGEVTVVSFRVRNHNSKVTVRLRDTYNSADGHVINPILNFGSNLYCFYTTPGAVKGANGETLTFADDEWTDFRFEIDRTSKNVSKIYVNGDEIVSVTLSHYPEFDWNDFKIEFRPSADNAGTLRAECDIDDFSFGASDDNGSLVQAVNVYSTDLTSGFEYAGALMGGDNKIKLTLDTSKLESASEIYAAEKCDGELVSLSVVNIPDSLTETAYISAELNVKKAGKSSVELYIWQDGTLTPYSKVISADISDISKAVSNGHPRVLTSEQRFEEIKKCDDEYITDLKQRVIAYADEICKCFTVTDSENEFYIGDEDNFSDVSNKVKKYGAVLGMAYQLTNNGIYSQKLYDILVAASQLTGWTDGNATNLTVAYMTEGFSLGFDWCYDGLTPEQRQSVADIAIGKCLGFAKDEYLNADRGSHTWSVTYTNHNPIPNASFITGSIAFAEYNPQLCQMILDYSSQRLKNFMAGLFPDGGWWEGSMYTNLLYAHMAKASETLALNFGIDDVIASNSFIQKSSDFFISMLGPCGTHNVAEEKTVVTSANPEMLWLAKLGLRADVCAWAIPRINCQNASNCVLALIWYDHSLAQGEYTFKNNYTRAVEHITLGSGSEGDALWLSVLGGVNMGTHKHLDLGSFICDYDGVRWATEFGCEDYYKGYHGETSEGKIFYRSRAEGHNTLEIKPTHLSGGQRMNDDNGISKAEVVKYNLRTAQPYAVYDMSTAYSDNASYVKRGFRLMKNNSGVIIRDEFSTSGDEDIINWYMHTDAEIILGQDGKSAVLTQDGKTLKLTVIEDGLTLSVVDSMTPEPILTELMETSKSNGLELSKQKKNTGKQKIQITRTGTGEGTITVVLSADSTIPADASLGLDDWR